MLVRNRHGSARPSTVNAESRYARSRHGGAVRVDQGTALSGSPIV